MEFLSKSYEDTVNIAKEIGKTLSAGSIVLLRGELGAGKTCFVRGVLAGLGFMSGVCSPTFTVVNEYPSNPPVNHFDLYRIKNPDELYEIGFFEYLDSGRINIIEWPERAGDILSEYKIIKIEIIISENLDEREINIEDFSL